jgi:ATP-dependent RNA helicase SUPV3L1/SUV3
MEKLQVEFTTPEFLGSLQLSRDDFDKEWRSFERSINLWIKQSTPELHTLAQEALRGKGTLATRLRYLFYAQACGGRFTSAELENQKEVADLRYPAEWYPATRGIQRTVHLHVGPTNSGKTYHALKRLEEAATGIYLGPLRLLAHEVYTRLNAKGKPCALVTGEEQRMPDGDQATMYSCTVEMAPLNTRFEVAVIDEIQMINHRDRGWAWTQAFFGLQATEVHLCGEARTVPLMRELCALVGDQVVVHEYERLTPLQVEPRSLKGKLAGLEKGDCIVAFTVVGIHALRREIERKTGKKCAIVYGSLPPETRAQQARLFNDPDNDYDFLVASDAIGMGLNLYAHVPPTYCAR